MVRAFNWIDSESEETVNNAQLRALGYINEVDDGSPAVSA